VTASYNLTAEQQAYHKLDEHGNATVTLRSKTPLKPRAVYAGEASMRCSWVHMEDSSRWHFNPTILNPTPAPYTQTTDGQDHILTVEFGKITPAHGLIDRNLNGEIRASAVHLNLPYANDLWVFILKSPTKPLKMSSDKTTLNIAHTLAYVTQKVEPKEDILHSYVTMHGEGFTEVTVNLKRRVAYGEAEEVLAQLKFGASAITWKPIVRNFDITLTLSSVISLGEFVGFLRHLGAEAKEGALTSLKSDFVLCDGPAIEYTLALRGDKKYIGKEEDKTALKVTF